MQDVALLINYVAQKGHYVTGGELHRPQELQEMYVKDGRSQTLDGQHQKRLAIDLFLFIDGKVTWRPEDYKFMGDFWESIRPENRWGGNFAGFVDAVHFETR